MGIERVRSGAMALIGATEAAGPRGASVRLRRDGTDVAPELVARLDALGIREALDELGEHEMAALLGMVESFPAQTGDLAADPGRAGRNHEEPSVCSRRASSARCWPGSSSASPVRSPTISPSG